jgi:hypothetical protein
VASSFTSATLFQVGTFRTTGTFDPNDVARSASFSGSSLVAARLGAVTLSGVNTDINASAVVSFGVGYSGPTSNTAANRGTLTVGSLTPSARTPSTTAQPTGSSKFFYRGLP